MPHDKGDPTLVMKTLAARTYAPVRIFYDGSGQSYERQTLPPLAPWDRRKLLARRMAERFADRTVRGWRVQHANNALLMAIGDDQNLDSWSQRLKGQRGWNEGIFLLGYLVDTPTPQM